MKDRRGAALIFLAIAAIAAGFRFPQLSSRPMHADEGVNGDRVGTLLEQGRYEYLHGGLSRPHLDLRGAGGRRACTGSPITTSSTRPCCAPCRR